MSTLSIKLVYVDVNMCLTYSDNAKEDIKMKKTEQMRVNDLCEIMWNIAMKEYRDIVVVVPWSRLRSCQAWTVETEHYIFLKSYNTIIAVIDKETDTLYDMLRAVYGYTHTSAMHIAKFNNEMGACKYGCVNRYTYRDI